MSNIWLRVVVECLFLGKIIILIFSLVINVKECETLVLLCHLQRRQYYEVILTFDIFYSIHRPPQNVHIFHTVVYLSDSYTITWWPIVAISVSTFLSPWVIILGEHGKIIMENCPLQRPKLIHFIKFLMDYVL